MSAPGTTPEPWRIKNWSDQKGFVVACNPETGKDMHVTLTCMEQDAHLIAAAPECHECADLLNGLCAWLLHRFGPDSPEGKEAIFRQEKALAALAKARGEA